MKTLIVEDDFTSRLLLQTFLSAYGECHCAASGTEAIEAFHLAEKSGVPYDLICMDIQMPHMDGHKAVQKIRTLEKDRFDRCTGRAKIVMTTALNDSDNVVKSAHEQCDGYLLKPVDTGKLLNQLRAFGLLPSAVTPSIPDAAEH
jgi:two-component system chemotaxis response regulator CheY